MSTLLERADQALPITEMSRSTKKIIDDLQSGQQDKYIVMRNNIPAAVMVSVQYYEDLMNLFDDLTLENRTIKRLSNLKKDELISHKDMLTRLKRDF